KVHHTIDSGRRRRRFIVNDGHSVTVAVGGGSVTAPNRDRTTGSKVGLRGSGTELEYVVGSGERQARNGGLSKEVFLIVCIPSLLRAQAAPVVRIGSRNVASRERCAHLRGDRAIRNSNGESGAVYRCLLNDALRCRAQIENV